MRQPLRQAMRVAAVSSSLLLAGAQAARGQFRLPIPLPPVVQPSHTHQSNSPAQSIPTDQLETVTVKAMQPVAQKELDNRLSQMPTCAAWDALEDDDGGPISLLMTVVSPSAMDDVKQKYAQGAQAKLQNSGAPTITAESAMKQFADTIAWQLKREAAGHQEKLVLVVGKIDAQGAANQKMVDQVFGKLVEDAELSDDFAIVYLNDKVNDKLVQQLSGGEKEWTPPDGSASNVKKQLFHPDSVYVIDSALRQWTDPDGEVFHSELVARLFHPRTEKLLAAREIRVDDEYYFHPTRGWISAAQDDQLAKAYGGKQPDLSPVFNTILPIAHKMLNTQIQARNQRQRNAQNTATFIDAGTRAAANQQLLDRLNKMPADRAWLELSQPGSKVSQLCSGLYPNGTVDEQMRLSHSAESKFRLQSMPKISSDDAISQLASAMVQRMQSLQDATHRQPVLVIGQTSAADPQSEQLVYDSYGAMLQNPQLQKSCVIVAVPPDKAAAILQDISGDAKQWTCPDGSNVSQVKMTTFDSNDLCLLQGAFSQAKDLNAHTFQTAMSTTLTQPSAGKQANASRFAVEVTYYFHPTRGWITSQAESQLAANYVEQRDDPPLPANLTVSVAPAAPAPAQHKGPFGF